MSYVPEHIRVEPGAYAAASAADRKRYRCLVHTEGIGHLRHRLPLIDHAQGEADLLRDPKDV